MNRIAIPLLLLLLFSCESTENEPQFEPELIEDPVEIDLCCESKEGLFFVYTASAEKSIVTVYDMDNDLDLTVGEYDESDQFNDQVVLAVSKNPGSLREYVEIATVRGEKYLIEVFNYGHERACGTLTIEHEETNTK